MADGLYAKGRQKFLEADIDWIADTIKAVLIDTAQYTVDLAAHEFLSSIAVGARLATSAAFAGKTATDGVADANDIVFSAVPNTSYEALAIYKDTGDAATSPLIAYIDSATGLPGQTNGGDVNVIWSAGANRIYKL